MSAQKYKCYGKCGKVRPLSKFYTLQTGRASPYCIDCNSEAVTVSRHRATIKRIGKKAFGKKIKAKEDQLNLMLEALSEAK